MAHRPTALLALLIASCHAPASDERVAKYAAGRLGVPAAELRVSDKSELTGAHHSFQLITREGAPVLVVVVPQRGEMFDSRTPDAFDRVARAEHAAAELSKLGAERVALWFAELGGGKCPMPHSDDAHFVKVTPGPSGVRLEYSAGEDKSRKIVRTCVIELAPDGSLVQGRLVEERLPEAQARAWTND